MLNKKKIDKKLRKYIKEHLSKGYTKHAVKHVLINHGYDESYVDKLLKKHSELEFVKKYAVIVSLIFIILIFPLNLIPTNKTQKIIGYATKISSGNEGCCTSICQQTFKNECYGRFVENKKCDELEDCRVGCCIDKEGYCLTNYLYGNCINGNGTYLNKDCSSVIFCTNVTDKSYTSRLHNIKSKNITGIIKIKPFAGYYGSSFNILYYPYEKTNVLQVSANIIDAGEIVGSVTLYDDGSHNDGAKNDNLYGNNWLSSKIRYFDGFKKLYVDVVVIYADGTRQSMSKAQSIVVLNNNKCLPISEWSNQSEKNSIIFSAKNYETLSNGYQKFESDVQYLFNTLFSIDKFFNNKGKFNIYRLEQSLSYPNNPTLINVISRFCPSYSNKKDLIIVLDNKEEYCSLEGLRVARTNPQVLFHKNISLKEINETFANFCGYVLTPKMIANNILSFAMPPTIVVYTLDNITYNTSNINLSLSISSLNYPVNNSVYFNETLMSNKILNEVTALNISLKLTNGTNVVLIEATDKNDNTAFVQLLLNATI